MKSIYNKKIFKDRRRELRKNLTLSEKILWQYLNARKVKGQKFFRQYSIGPYIVDFYCPKTRLVIELDGESHLPEDQQEYDIERTRYLNGHNIKVIRFWNDEIINDIDNVILQITNAIRNAPLKVRGVRGVMYLPEVGVEPTSLSAHDFESCMFASFITRASIANLYA